MQKIIRYSLSLAALILLLFVALLLFVQSEWAKDKIGTVLEEIALQNGVKLKIEKIEGEIPLKWTLSNVHIDLSETDSIDLNQVRLRLSFMSLLRKQIGISYLSINKGAYRFTSSETVSSGTFSLPRLQVRKIQVKEFEVVNLATGAKELYSLEGRYRVRSHTLALTGKVQSPHLDLGVFIQGDEKTNQTRADIFLEVKSAEALAPFALLPSETAFKLNAHCNGLWNFKNLSGEFKGEFQKLALPQLKGLDQNLTVAARFSLSADQSLSISSLVLKSDLLSLEGSAQLNSTFFPQKIDCTFLFPQLSHLEPSLQGVLKGRIDYNEKTCSIVLQSNQIHLRDAVFKEAKFDLQAELLEKKWGGSFTIAALHPELGMTGSGNFKWHSPQLLVNDFSLTGPYLSIVGDFGFDLPSFINLKGGLSFQCTDLSPFTQVSPLPLAGQVGGTVDLEGEDLKVHALAKTLKVGEFLSQHVALDLFATDIFSQIKGKLACETQDSYFADLYLSSFDGSIGWNTIDWDYNIEAAGDWKHPFQIATQGHFAASPHSFELHCNKLLGHLLEKNIFLQEPVKFSLREKEMALQDFHMNIEDGFVRSAFHITPEATSIMVQADHFPLDFLTLLSPRLSLKGLSSIDIALQGVPTDLTGHLNFLLERADIFPAGSETPIQTKASIQAHLNHDTVQIHSHIVATDEQFVELSATLPVIYQLNPFELRLNPHKTMAGECTIEGHVEQLFDFVNIGTQRFGGFLSCRLVCSGTPIKPKLFGPLSVQGGFYQNYFIGIGFKNGNVQAVANGGTLDVSHIDVTDDDKGTSTATAVFQLQPTLPFSIQGDVSHFRVIRFDWLTAFCSGPFTITGNLEKGLAQGSLVVDEAQIQIPENLPSNVPTIPVTFINQPPAYAPPADLHSEPYPFHYDLQIHGDENLRLSGKGLDAELAGSMHLLGKNLNVTPIGTLKTKKGKFSFSGKDFKITDGEISFTEAGSFINITGNLDLPDLTVTVLFRGSLRSPDLIFQSNPPLPTSSILARILFNKDVSELNASQAAQLAYTIINLSGGAGPNILESIHKNLGIDRLGVSASEETGKVSVQIGKYLMEGVLITLSQSTEQSQVIVEVELKGGFVLQAETRFNNQGKFSFKWNKNY